MLGGFHQGSPSGQLNWGRKRRSYPRVRGNGAASVTPDSSSRLLLTQYTGRNWLNAKIVESCEGVRCRPARSSVDVCQRGTVRCCRKAKCTAHSSRQLMCQSSRGPVQSPEAACPLHVAPQPVLEASVVTTVCRDTCSRGTPAHRKARSVQGLRERRHCWEIPTRSLPRRHAHLGTRECSQC